MAQIRRVMHIMARPPMISADIPGPYDAAVPQEDLWFLPQEDVPAAGAVPWQPRAGGDRKPLTDARDWAAAQADLSAELAAVAVLFGGLDERLRAAPAGWRHRLALLEAAELSWWAGDRIGAERLALWEGQHLAGVHEDQDGLARATWALRRLSGGFGAGGSRAGSGYGALLRPGAAPAVLAAFLGRQGEAPEGVADLAEVLEGLGLLHPLVQGAAVFHGWRMLGRGGPVAAIEAAVLASVLASRMGRGAALFVPVAAGGVITSAGGPVLDRLSVWLRGAERAVLAALLHLDRVRAWAVRAEAEVASLQGRTPGLLLAVLAEWPVVTAALAEAHTGASRASVQRNLAGLEARGLVREITGQGRYRAWAARI